MNFAYNALLKPAKTYEDKVITTFPLSANTLGIVNKPSLPLVNASSLIYNLYRKSQNKFQDFEVDEIESCPLCHSGGHPHFEGGYVVSNYEATQGVHLFVILYCTVCKKHFVVKYLGVSGNYKLEYTFPTNPHPILFDEIINNISPQFSIIYNQAKQAEDLGLNELVGIGYRKSLEFLVKDYLIRVQEENEQTIKSALLGTCINMITDNKIQTLAKGATWLGNDETHYEKRHPEYDVSYIKLFITTLVEYIVGENAFKQALQLIQDTNQNNQQ